MVPFQFLTALGYEVHVVSPGKKKNDKVRFDLQLFEFLVKNPQKYRI
jgi:putative intracellular protease/amidase